MPSSVIPLIQQLESSAMVVGAAAGHLCITRMSAESTVMSHNDAFERQSPGAQMRDERTGAQARGRGGTWLQRWHHKAVP